MDSPKDLNKENKENADYMFVGDKIEKSSRNRRWDRDVQFA